MTNSNSNKSEALKSMSIKAAIMANFLPSTFDGYTINYPLKKWHIQMEVVKGVTDKNYAEIVEKKGVPQRIVEYKTTYHFFYEKM
jgi:hypothetical protein